MSASPTPPPHTAAVSHSLSGLSVAQPDGRWAPCQPFELPPLTPGLTPGPAHRSSTIQLRVVLGRVRIPRSASNKTPLPGFWRLDRTATDLVEIWWNNQRVANGRLHRVGSQLAIEVCRGTWLARANSGQTVGAPPETGAG